MANSKLKLIYFEVRGLAEVPRLILAYAGKEYENVRVKIEDWPTVKPTIKPFNQLPLLDIDGQVVCQSIAIRGFLAREFGLYGKNNMEALAIEIVLGTALDIFKEQAKWFYLPDGPEKEKLKVASPTQAAKFLEYLDSLLATNKTGYFVGNSLTLADLVAFDVLTGYCRLSIDFSEEKYPWLAKNKAKVLENPNIAAYVASRPDTVI